MNSIWPQLPALQIVVPLLAAILVAFLRRGPLAFLLTLSVSVLMPFISAALLWQAMRGGTISYHLGGWVPPIGIEYRIDVFGGFVLVLVSSVSAFMIPFARQSVEREIHPSKHAWFYCMYLLCLTGLLGITVTGDAFNAFVFLEISSLSTYTMIALGHDRRALLAAFQYLIIGTIGATFYVIGVGFLYLITGTLNLADIAVRLIPAALENPPAVYAALAFITVGVSLKLALFPLHTWLPNAYAYAPSFVTVFLSATATKVAVYLLVRYFFSVFGVAIDFRALPVTEMMIALSLAAMFIASFVAVYETNVKRMLAYSSVAQIGYITLGVGLANQTGLTGGIIHLFNHAIMKAALFLAIGAVVYRIGSCKLNDLAGIGRKMPCTMIAFAVAGFGLIGTPGTAGFISKWYLAIGALDHGWWPLVTLIVASSLIAVVYVGRVLEIVWFRAAGSNLRDAKDPPLLMMLPILAFAFATIYFGFDTRLTAGISELAAKALIGGLR